MKTCSDKKDPKKDNSHKCKVNTLARYMSFGPFSTKNSLVKKGVTKPNSNAHKKWQTFDILIDWVVPSMCFKMAILSCFTK